MHHIAATAAAPAAAAAAAAMTLCADAKEHEPSPRLTIMTTLTELLEDFKQQGKVKIQIKMPPGRDQDGSSTLLQLAGALHG
jgi:hypothetical protein